ncbi:L-3-cyanoalanine synthase 2, mitochondrial [Dendrobium catenatum]|uniref:L-3-cyanoalanine synthase 2, mitochondrial n=1 Tax=Dendrobium catenatum TaxID=906689 RepID=A0A2I0VK17_9ASPA|nr:L-3-cyanoalanine synthase 2, mitochondrial [Dendrobium catenatum]
MSWPHNSSLLLEILYGGSVGTSTDRKVEPSESIIFNGANQITGNGVGFEPDILDMEVMEKVLEAHERAHTGVGEQVPGVLGLAGSSKHGLRGVGAGGLPRAGSEPAVGVLHCSGCQKRGRGQATAIVGREWRNSFFVVIMQGKVDPLPCDGEKTNYHFTKEFEFEFTKPLTSIFGKFMSKEPERKKGRPRYYRGILHNEGLVTIIGAGDGLEVGMELVMGWILGSSS